MTDEVRRDRVKAVSNRVFLLISGRWLRAYSVVEHVGRVSGRAYRNPVSAYPLGDGFVVPVLYGADSQWVRNVLGTGHCTLRTRGTAHALQRPELIGARQALAAFPVWQRAMLRRRGIDVYLWAHLPGS